MARPTGSVSVLRRWRYTRFRRADREPWTSRRLGHQIENRLRGKPDLGQRRSFSTLDPIQNSSATSLSEQLAVLVDDYTTFVAHLIRRERAMREEAPVRLSNCIT